MSGYAETRGYFDRHKRNIRWTVETGREEHRAMQRVLSKISPLKTRIRGADPEGTINK